MIPKFNDSGYLPAGIHVASVAEIEERFGRESELRRAQMESLRWLIDLAKQAGVSRLILNGSFVTDIIEPNDVDCVLLDKQEYPKDENAEEELLEGLPFLEISILPQPDFEELVNEFFAMDRYGVPKGVVEVML